MSKIHKKKKGREGSQFFGHHDFLVCLKIHIIYIYIYIKLGLEDNFISLYKNYLYIIIGGFLIVGVAAHTSIFMVRHYDQYKKLATRQIYES